ncbi:tetratricopeptide repeat protein [bacterium]|nr:tetratricopeptide repeat protein [bacterium]
MNTEQPCIAILPFALPEGGKQPSLGELSRGLAALIEGRLRLIPNAQVYAHHLIFAPDNDPGKRGLVVRHSMWSVEEALELPTPPGVKPTHILQGSLQYRETIDLHVELIDVSGGFTCFRTKIEAAAPDFLGEFFPVLGQVVDLIAPAIRPPIREAISRQSTNSFRAFRAYLRGVARLVTRQLPVQSRNPEAPFEPFLEALQADPHFDEPCRALAMLAQTTLAEGGEESRDAALNALREACNLAPHFPPFRGLLGNYLFQDGRFDEALPLLEDFLKHAAPNDPLVPSSYVRMATVLHHQGQTMRAYDLLNEAARRFPRDADVLEGLGVCHAEAGNAREAENCWRRVLEENPRRSTALTNLGMMCWERGEVRKAEILLERAIEGPEINPMSHRRLFDFLVEQKKLERADEVATEWVETQAEDWQAWLRLGQVRRLRGQTRAALYCLNKAEGLAGSEDTESEILLARFALDFPGDFQIFERAMTARPKPAKSLEEQERLQQEHRAGMVKTLRNLSDRHPRYPFLWEALARLLMESGQYESAISAQQRLVALSGRSPARTNELGMMLLKADQRDEAIDAFRRAVNLEPANGTYRANLATVLIQENRNLEAFEHLEAAATLAPDNQVVQSLLDDLRAHGFDPEIEPEDESPGGFLQRFCRLLQILRIIR